MENNTYKKIYWGLGFASSISLAIKLADNFIPPLTQGNYFGVIAEGNSLYGLTAITFGVIVLTKMTELQSSISDYMGVVRTANVGIKEDSKLIKRFTSILSNSNVLSQEEVKLVSPSSLDEFDRVFHGSKNIYAYNPPLELLVNSEKHRRVIYDCLNNEGTSYHMIAGQQLTTRLRELNNELFKQFTHYDKGEVKKCMKRMKVLVYTHTADNNQQSEDLHTAVSNWMEPGSSELRGLSYFVIDKGFEKIVLLYILGPPFVRSFVVPQQAILIGSKTKTFELYTKLHDVFQDRWNKLLYIKRTSPDNCKMYTLDDFEPL